jgi:hypothetical protein
MQKQSKNWLEINSDAFEKLVSETLDNKSLDLSRRQIQILKLIAEGHTLKDIATQLNITKATARTYRTKFMAQIQETITEKSASQVKIRHRTVWIRRAATIGRPPINPEYILYLLLRRNEREVVIGDLIEGYGQVFQRFDKRSADIWFYKQVAGSLLPLLRRTLLRLGALVWLGRILRRLVS